MSSAILDVLLAYFVCYFHVLHIFILLLFYFFSIEI